MQKQFIMVSVSVLMGTLLIPSAQAMDDCPEHSNVAKPHPLLEPTTLLTLEETINHLYRLGTASLQPSTTGHEINEFINEINDASLRFCTDPAFLPSHRKTLQFLRDNARQSLSSKTAQEKRNATRDAPVKIRTLTKISKELLNTPISGLTFQDGKIISTTASPPQPYETTIEEPNKTPGEKQHKRPRTRRDKAAPHQKKPRLNADNASPMEEEKVQNKRLPVNPPSRVTPVAPDVTNEASNDPAGVAVSDVDQQMIDSFLCDQPTHHQTDSHVNSPDGIKNNNTSDVPLNIDSSQALGQSTDTEFTPLLEDTLLN